MGVVVWYVPCVQLSGLPLSCNFLGWLAGSSSPLSAPCVERVALAIGVVAGDQCQWGGLLAPTSYLTGIPDLVLVECRGGACSARQGHLEDFIYYILKVTVEEQSRINFSAETVCAVFQGNCVIFKSHLWDQLPHVLQETWWVFSETEVTCLCQPKLSCLSAACWQTHSRSIYSCMPAEGAVVMLWENIKTWSQVGYR